MRKFLWSTLGGICGVGLLIALAAGLGRTLTYFQLGAALAKRTEHGMGDFIFISIGLGGFALLALYVFACGRA